MSKQVMISLLKQGSNGEEILQILDTIIGNESSDATIMPVESAELEF